MAIFRDTYNIEALMSQSTNVEQLDEKQFGAPAKLSPTKPDTVASTINAILKAKLGNKEPKPTLKSPVKESVESLDEISLKTAINVHTQRAQNEYEDDSGYEKGSDDIYGKIARKFGKKGTDAADAAAEAGISGRKDAHLGHQYNPGDKLKKPFMFKPRTNKNGTMNKQDSGYLGRTIKDRLGKHGKSNLPEGVDLEEGKLPDWAQAEFDAAFKKKASPKAATRNNDDDVSAFNPKTDGKYKAKVAPKPTRVNRGTYGRAIIDHEDEHPLNEPSKHPHTTADKAMEVNPWVPKVKSPESNAAKKVSQGVTTSGQKQAKASDYALERLKKKAAAGDRAAKLRLARLKVESYVFNDNQFELVEGETYDKVVLDIYKEGLIYNYALSIDGDVFQEGAAVTAKGAFINASRIMESLAEEHMHLEGQYDRIKSIVKSMTIEEATSSVRPGFDAKKHATELMNHETWYKNHYSYSLRSAQKRKDKGTFDSELNKKTGVNLSKLGDFHLKTKLNAAEHRAVGEHIAKHIENGIGA